MTECILSNAFPAGELSALNSSNAQQDRHQQQIEGDTNNPNIPPPQGNNRIVYFETGNNDDASL